MKRKLGETLCSLLVTMSMILGLIPGISLTAYAAPTEELLTTITATGQEQASYSTENVATISFSYTASGASSYHARWGWWGYGWIATVTPADGYTITKCVFYDDSNRTATDSEAPFVVETTEEDKTPQVNGAPIMAYQSKGITKIEVYGYVTPAASYEVTYSVVNGTWSDGTTADKTETVASGSVPTSVPSGMIANSGYTGGSWNPDPSSATITGDTTFTYTFEAIPTYTVTYSVVNGTWSDGTTADKTETAQSGTAPASVPSGMIAGSGFTGGSWNADPASATITGDTTFTYTFEAIPTYTVTYSVVNGTWSDGTTADKTETAQSGTAPASVPSGMIAGSGFTGGSWNADPASATITGDTTFTYTFEAIPTYTVTYSVVNGTWSDGTTADKTETVASGASPASIPTGMIPSSGYTGGAWDTDPSGATITGNTTYTYTFTAVPTYTVTYSIVNGTWADGTTADKTETVASGASPASVPTGMIPSSGYTGGAWDTDPSGATITGDTTFTYTFKAESVDPDPDTPTPDPDPVTPDPEPVTPSDTPAPVITPEQAREMTIRHFVERIYLIALNRSYDVTGRDYWVDQITNKDASGSAIARGFFNSQEFIARELDNEEFVNILYRVFFDREPDTQGFANWINALENGATRSEVINGFTGSTEWTSMCARFGINA